MRKLDIQEKEDTKPKCPTCGARLLFRHIPLDIRPKDGPDCGWRCGFCRTWYGEEAKP